MFYKRTIFPIFLIVSLTGCVLKTPLVIHTVPDGATVYVDEKNQGQSPIEVDVESTTQHAIKASKPGYRDAVKVIAQNKLTPGIKEILILQLQPLHESERPSKETKISAGTIEIATKPDESEIWVDGQFIGQTPAQIRLSPGDHTITVKKKGYKDSTKLIKVLEGSVARLKIELEP
jgi:hypothetical protein